MKKFILSATFLAFAGLTAVQANEVKNLKTTVTVAQDSLTRTPVKLEELPDAVKATLASDVYKGWDATEAWWVKDGAKEYYQINIKKEAETGSVKIDKDGKPVE